MCLINCCIFGAFLLSPTPVGSQLWRWCLQLTDCFSPLLCSSSLVACGQASSPVWDSGRSSERHSQRVQAHLCTEAAPRSEGFCSAERRRQTGKGSAGALQHVFLVCRSVTRRVMKCYGIFSCTECCFHAHPCPYWPVLAGICPKHFIDLSLHVNTCLGLSRLV